METHVKEKLFSSMMQKNKEKKREKIYNHVLKITFKAREIIQEGVTYFHIIHFPHTCTS
jgi:hypothetical protein